jgi:hypothetical protein
MPVIVRYNEGFDTKLFMHTRLENLINAMGEPTYDEGRRMWVFTDGTTYILKNPFYGDKRRVVGLSTVPWNDADKGLRDKLSKPDPMRRRCYCH